jgi:putative Mg2+ transporter-C (MgtC) family protein
MYLNLQGLGPQLVFVSQIILAVLLGAVAGWQREKIGKAAGARTYALVAAGSCLFTILSINGFGDSEASRVAAQIVVGIGFLGAGTILHRESRISGLTTAAGLWISAAIGMAVGTGLYLVAVLTALIMLAVLMINEKEIFKKGNTKIKK